MNKNFDPKDEKAMRIAFLIAGFIRQTLTEEEHDELDRWVEESPENTLLFEELTDEDNIEIALQKLKATDTTVPYQRLRSKIDFTAERKRRTIWPYAAAASLILVLVSAYFIWTLNKKEIVSPMVTATKHDLAPGDDKATLVLADGRTIVLETRANGEIVGDSLVQIIKLDSGQLTYKNAGITTGALQYNTLTTPKGGQYQITLSDGTKVWLNAASSLRYPVAFGDNERVVELTGEAYLEVAHDKAKPFYVRSNGKEIKVLGTSFNIDAYKDETFTTTLLEGSIQLSFLNQQSILKPGQDGVIDAAGRINLVSSPDLPSATAWIKGMFRYRNQRIENILAELARWYDAQIVYEGKIDHRFNADISRKLPVSKVLALLEKTGRVHFELRNKTIIVRP